MEDIKLLVDNLSVELLYTLQKHVKTKIFCLEREKEKEKIMSVYTDLTNFFIDSELNIDSRAALQMFELFNGRVRIVDYTIDMPNDEWNCYEEYRYEQVTWQIDDFSFETRSILHRSKHTFTHKQKILAGGGCFEFSYGDHADDWSNTLDFGKVFAPLDIEDTAENRIYLVMFLISAFDEDMEIFECDDGAVERFIEII